MEQRPTKRQHISRAPSSRTGDKPFLSPSVNRLMHDRNLYKDRKFDFKALAEKYEDFRPFVFQLKGGKCMINFKNPAGVKELIRALLNEDFGLKVDLPDDRLIPTLPNRVNYIHWLEDLIPQDHNLHGIDIGCGASCIYPLIGHKLSQNKWSFVATELDESSCEYAMRNVSSNGLTEAIDVRRVMDPKKVLCGVVNDDEVFDFCMCNPPFFDSEEQRDQDVHRAGRVASSIEVVCEGGELAFIRRIIDDSLILRDRVKWYTTMMGMKSTLKMCEVMLGAVNARNVTTGRFCQGRTVRWVIGWQI